MSESVREIGWLVTVRDRYGFLRPDDRPEGDADCFVLLSALPPGVAPRQGLRLSYTRALDPRTGRTRAARVAVADGTH